jgi:hypothetical protein
MIVNTVPDTRIVTKYDFILAGGIPFSITIDDDLGDTVEWDDMSITFHKVSRPSPFDPEQNYPGEETTLFLNHVIAITKIRHEVKQATPEQRDQFKSLLHKVPNTIQ